MGDATNMVIILAGELLKKAEELLRMGLKTSDIVQGFEKAQGFALKCLEGGILPTPWLFSDGRNSPLQNGYILVLTIFAGSRP